MDYKNITFWTFIGALIWEFIKQIISFLFKRSQDSNDSKRKLLRDDVEQLIALTHEIHDDAMKYYALAFDSLEAKGLSTQIKSKMKTVGMRLSALNIQFIKNGNHLINVSLWTEFKTAATENLDVTRIGVWDESDRRITNIYKKTNRLQLGLNNARYRIV
jgi:hypothetical protein